jgi:hypothetical protein
VTGSPRKTYALPSAPCEACGEEICFAKPVGGDAPPSECVGSFLVCSACGALYELLEGQKLKHLDHIPRDIEDETQLRIKRVRAAVLLAHATSPKSK